MRIEQLEYMAAVTQHGSLRRASEHLHISQPALSEAIAKLERELGVTLLDRRRSGARISREGQELLRNMAEVLEAVDRLRVAAGDQTAAARVVRVGTVNAGTARLLLPAVRRLHVKQPGSAVEIRNLQQEAIHTGLAEGGLDLGLVNLLGGDDLPPGVTGHRLLHGRPVAVLPGDHPLTQQEEVSAADLRHEPFIGMRPGYLMHRFAHRLFGADLPLEWHSTDGAEMGKMMVAEGLGISLLPDYSVVGDPLERVGLIAARPISPDRTVVTMTLLQRRGVRMPQPVLELIETLVGLADTQQASKATAS
ncbi:MAG: LysR family transcriptional regulator [Nocardioidaceae bacterium]